MQELKEIKERLNSLQTPQLFDILKNSKQYGYTDEVRFYVLSLLKQKGFSQEDIELTGSFQNAKYENADRIFTLFKMYSRIAFIAYLALVFLRMLSQFDFIDTDLFWLFILSINIALLGTYLFCLLKSFISQSDYYKLTGEDFSYGALIYLFVGMPFYIVMYFVFTAQMRERMKTVF